MSRNRQQVRVDLDARGLTSLPEEDVVAILRAADELIASGGRTLLSKILRGARDRKVLELKLDGCPAYGHYRHLGYKDIMARIDWVIQSGFLQIEYSGRLPLLVFTPAGWEIERETISSELLALLREMAKKPVDPESVLFLKDRNRSMILMLLDKIEASKDPGLLHVLEQWKRIDYKKVQERIDKVMQSLTRAGKT